MFSPVGSLGTAAVFNTGRSLSTLVSRDVDAGQVVIVWVAWPQIFSVFNPSDGSQYVRCEDSQGNLYSRVAAHVNASTFYGSGTIGLLYVAFISRPLTGGVDTITTAVDPAHQPGANWARAMSVEEFDIEPGFRPAVGLSGYPASRSGATTPPPALSGSFLGPDDELLYLYNFSTFGPPTDTWTFDSDYTLVTPAGISGGGGATESVSLWGGYRIDTLSGNSETVAAPGYTTLRETIQVLNALKGVPVGTAFPFQPVLDDFNRADENPLDNGTWDTTENALNDDFGKLVGNEATGTSVGGGSQWLEDFENCAEVYYTIVETMNNYAYVEAGGDANLHTFGGVGVSWVYAGGIGWSLRAGNVGFFGQIDGETETWLEQGPPGNTGGVTSNGEGLGIRKTKDVGVWVYRPYLRRATGDDFEEFTPLYKPAGGTGRIAFGANPGGGSSHIDDFGGGPYLPCGAKFVPQIYRRVLGVA